MWREPSRLTAGGRADVQIGAARPATAPPHFFHFAAGAPLWSAQRPVIARRAELLAAGRDARPVASPESGTGRERDAEPRHLVARAPRARLVAVVERGRAGVADGVVEHAAAAVAIEQ